MISFNKFIFFQRMRQEQIKIEFKMALTIILQVTKVEIYFNFSYFFSILIFISFVRNIS